MSTLIVGIFDRGWSLVADLEPESRTLRMMQTTAKPIVIYEHELSPADAARLDMGNHEAGLYFDGQDRPVLCLVECHDAGHSLIWPCHRGETYWTGEPS